jgi:hypothetical protein
VRMCLCLMSFGICISVGMASFPTFARDDTSLLAAKMYA